MRDVSANLALRLRGLCKDYRLYDSPAQLALDCLGFYRLLPGLRPRMRMHHALAGIDLDIGRGERVGILGRNGAGKTTLLKLVIGNFAPTSGSVQVHGKVHSLIQTGLGFEPAATGYDNIGSALTYDGMSGEELEHARADVIEFCELGAHLHQPFRTYSAGMAARLQFATATAIRPDILIVDEVLGAGDRYFTHKSAVRMRKLALSGCTLLLVSHATQQVLNFCERAVWIEEGRLMMDGPVLDVVDAYDVFLERRTQAYRRGLPASALPQAADASRMVAAMTSQLADGRKVYRWPGNLGLKIDRLGLGDGNGPRQRFRAGDLVVIDMHLKAEVAGSFCCRYLITFWTPQGERIGRIENHRDEFTLQAGETHAVRVEIKDFPLTRGDYLLTFAVYDVRSQSTQDGADIRFDVLAHALQMTVEGTPANRGFLIAHPSAWMIDERAPPQVSDMLSKDQPVP